MKICSEDPGHDFTLLAFNGDLVGCVVEADTEEGYIIQATYAEPCGPGAVIEVSRVRREGKVAVIGNSETDSPEQIRAAMNKHREECGLAPLEEQ